MPLPRLRFRSSKARPSDRSSAKSPPATPIRRFLHTWVLPLALAFAILTPIRSSIADWNDVPSGSMRPTILEGDRIYVNKLAYGLRIPFTTTWLARWETPHRGDIVTLKSPADGVRLVKRVIGLPGDRVAMRNNRLVINGKPVGLSLLVGEQPIRLPDGRTIIAQIVEEQIDRLESDPPEGVECNDAVCSHTLTIVPGAISPSTIKEFTVPEGQYFVMGDNRDMSRDSRMIGCVPLESIYGRSTHVALSVDPDDHYLPRFDRWFLRMK
ncbi:MAG: signal peptidase I [Phycisphaerales bacterium]